MSEQEQNKSTALRELIEKGRKNNKLNYTEVLETLEDLGYTGDAIDKFNDTLERMGIELMVDYSQDPIDEPIELDIR